MRTTARAYATHQFTQAETFLTWLHERDIDPGAVTQRDIDTWYVSHRVHQRHEARGFLIWATEQRHLPRALSIPRVKFGTGLGITQQRRLALLRQYLNKNQAPLAVLTAACLMLLYAQPLSRIHRLTTSDLIDRDGELFIRLGDPPSPVPEPLAALLHQLASTSTTSASWLPHLQALLGKCG